MTIECRKCPAVYDDGLQVFASSSITIDFKSNCPNCGVLNLGLNGTYDFDEFGNATPSSSDKQPTPTNKRSEISDFELQFQNALLYDLSGQILESEMFKTKTWGIAFPAHTLDAFSIELYLKLLLKIQKHSWVGRPVHSLLPLYCKLTEDSRAEIEKLYIDEILPTPQMQEIIKKMTDAGKVVRYELIELLEEASETFVVYRYLHEPKVRQNYKGIWSMPLKQTFRRYIIKNYPEWEIHRLPYMTW